VNGNATTYGTQFSRDEIDAEERKPKRKVAVFIGYAGTGYKGMQITPREKTIEGDLFQAFVKAGAISKANADDPKKASLVRCARTDKGVHAAGNMISLKLIVEDPDIVQKINAHLPQQIRVWGIERTIGSFSCYQACDSRFYEYLIPSYSFLPPHPSSFLAKKCEELADETGDRKGYEARQAEVTGFWEKIDEDEIKPILESIDEDIRWEVVKALQGEDEASAKAVKAEADVEQVAKVGKSGSAKQVDGQADGMEKMAETATVMNMPPAADAERGGAEHASAAIASAGDSELSLSQPQVPGQTTAHSSPAEAANPAQTLGTKLQLTPEEQDRLQRLKSATKRLRAAYLSAKRRYRIPAQRIARIQEMLGKFVGTKNYHNFTIQKTFRDPSSKRHIKSFAVHGKPILIGDHAEQADEEKMEWLSLKVHGQSFMMHQIRKMIGMVALLVRCGGAPSTLDASLGSEKYSIPKVPGLGLLLERPVFESYNVGKASQFEKAALVFDPYEAAMDDFKQREIYARIFREEAEGHEFSRFFNQMDNFREPHFLYVTSKGLGATRGAGGKRVGMGPVEESEDERENSEGGG